MGRKKVSEMTAEEYAAYKEKAAGWKRNSHRKETAEKTVYVCDFETSTQKWFEKYGKTEVWAWAMTNAHIDNPDPIDMTDNAEVTIGEWDTTKPADSLIEELKSDKYHDGDIIYLHNFKFDGRFLCHILCEHGFTDVSKKVAKRQAQGRFYKKCDGEFALLASGSAWYSLDLTIGTTDDDRRTLHIRDSLKRIPMSVKQMAKEFKLPILKGDIDYDRDPHKPCTPKERKYIRHDVLIVAEVLRQQYQEGFTEMTCASYAYNRYKEYLATLGLSLKTIFPALDPDDEAFARRSYDGGEVVANPALSGTLIGNPFSKKKPCYTWDINSMYPAVYSCMPMPFGKPFHTVPGNDFPSEMKPAVLRKFRGQDHRYFIEVKRAKLSLKKGHVPSIGVAVGFGKRQFAPKIIITDKVFADIRFEMMLMDYDVEELELGRVDVYAACTEFFFGYVQNIVAEKNIAGANGQLMRKALAKIKMNSLYGKFGQAAETDSISCVWDPVYGEVEMEHFTSTGTQKYVPVASIITAEARFLLVSQANKFGYGAVAYMDTDSIHVLQDVEVNGRYITHNCVPYRRRPLPANKDEKMAQISDTLTREQQYNNIIEFEYGHPTEIWCDEYDLGAFKIEANFACAKYLRAKTYFEGSSASEAEIQALRASIANEEWNGEDFIIPGHLDGKEFTLIGCIKGAGIPDEGKMQITADNFEFGLVIDGKLLPKTVKGGCILVPSQYEISEDRTIAFGG